MKSVEMAWFSAVGLILTTIRNRLGASQQVVCKWLMRGCADCTDEKKGKMVGPQGLEPRKNGL